MKQTHSVREAATILGVHAETLRRGIRRGVITAIRTNTGRGGGGYRIHSSEVSRLASTVFASEDRGSPLELRAHGKYLLRIGERAAAQRCYEDALRASRDLNDELGEAKATYKLGQIAFKAAQYAKAERLYQTALPIFERKDPTSVESVYLALGDLALRRDDIGFEEKMDAAQACYSAIAEPLAGGILSTERGQSVAKRGLARVALERGDTGVAQFQVNAALEIAATYDDSPMKADIWVSMGELDEKRGLGGYAIERYERAIETYEGFGFRDRADETREKIERAKAKLTINGRAVAPGPID